ncbi:MAG: hypothetical protein QNJ18_13100 [Xenococcaceae cyanobacterium MO_167.B52]|nr:hypothetical protein [Xenococcaceae cyanobacterium MO_167.B52]
MSYLKKPALSQQQDELRELIDERLKKEEIKIRQRVYQWLCDNQYFTDNELFDFYFCVAQNLAAVEILGASGEKILQAKTELEKSAQIYQTQVIKSSNQMIQQLENQLSSIKNKQDDLEWKLVEMLENLATEHQNLKTISTGLVNSTAVLLKKQKQMLVQSEAARKFAFNSVILAWAIPVMALLGWGVIFLLTHRLLK